jgi:hypothetical protein
MADDSKADCIAGLYDLVISLIYVFRENDTWALLETESDALRRC